MSYWYVLDHHHASGIDHSRKALFLQYPWARSCMKCWRLMTFAKAKFWPDTFAFSLLSLVRHILVGHVNILQSQTWCTILPCYALALQYPAVACFEWLLGARNWAKKSLSNWEEIVAGLPKNDKNNNNNSNNCNNNNNKWFKLFSGVQY